MKFTIQLTYANSIYNMEVELIKKDQRFEYFKIYNPQSPQIFIIIRGNRPMLRIRGLKKKPIDWKLMEGEVKNTVTYNQVIKLIDSHLNPPTPSNKKPVKVPKDAQYRPTRRKDQYSQDIKIPLSERAKGLD